MMQGRAFLRRQFMEAIASGLGGKDKKQDQQKKTIGAKDVAPGVPSLQQMFRSGGLTG